VGRKAYRRWPLETTTLFLAAIAHLLMISSNKTWSGDLSYGPRYMLESIVLLMPLTLPAFEMALDRAPKRATIAVAAVVFLGFVVQLIGVGVKVSAIELKRMAAGIAANNAWVFVPSASPIVSDLQDLVSRRNLSPWAIRALAIPDFALLLLLILVAIVLFGGWQILQYFRAPEAEPANAGSRAFPMAIVAAAVIPIVIGLAISRPLKQTPSIHGLALLNAGLAEQRAGHVVSAEEDYAMVLTLYPSNKFAWFDMGVMEEEAGRINEAILLYQAALRDDPNFSPPKDNLEYIMRTRFGFGSPHPALPPESRSLH
jgi:tetratricopeptide (TPR) repeat protein